MTNAIIPITRAGEWRTVIDVMAVSTYVIAGLPLIWIALQEFGLVNRVLDQMGKLKIHAICVALFLVFGHIAMIAGMLDPSILGYKGASSHQMSSGADSHEFCHPEEHEKMAKQHQQMMGNEKMKQNMPMNAQGHNH